MQKYCRGKQTLILYKILNALLHFVRLQIVLHKWRSARSLIPAKLDTAVVLCMPVKLS